ncbi:protein SERAC1 isoform X2 [Cimex lectularius]|uniref:Protein SERAC1 n=1 Tax=Cimex lectularius TaxID=79782 RepID=A0A8I6RAP4_CIMLE|nr:protein SERAC1 isoform X2 [Cimex lectularius]
MGTTLNKVQVVSSYLGLVVPILVSIYYSWANKQRHIINHIRKQISTVDFELLFSTINVGDVLQVTVSNKLVRSLFYLRQDQQLKPCPEKSVNCEVLHDPGEEVREADIIFIHGIKGALHKTWKQGIWHLGQLQVLNMKEDTTWDVKTVELGEERSVCWPKDWLPKDCPTARVIALNYTTDPYLWRPFFFSKHNRTNMEERAWEMIHNLLELGVGKHSIIWVGHSKGGLYVKQMLVNACEMPDEKVTPLAKNTKAIMFYSVPHRGSPLASFNLPLFRQSIELTEVQKNCKEVLTLHTKFLNLLSSKQLDVEIKSFIETRLTLMGILYVRIVSEESADAEMGEMYGVPLDHRNICKPKNRECFLYKELVNMVQDKCASL